ncbi:DUF342 domain-containing protein [Kaarinaea lacus]
MEAGPYTIEDDLVLKLSDDGKFLQAEFPIALDRRNINTDWFQLQLSRYGLDRYKLNKDAISNFIREYNEGVSASTINIAEKVDGEYHIKLDDDLMAAYLSLSPPLGGQPVTKAMIMGTIQDHGITSGLLESEIDLALQNSDAHHVLIAKGQVPDHGQDGYLENLIPDAKDRRPRIDSAGIAHYHDIGELITVKRGDKLMRRIPATVGKAGVNIKGEVVPPAPGQDTMFAPNLNGTEISPDDPNLLLAAINGQPILVDNGAIVEKTLVIDNVNLATGNIKFDGTVIVKGDVTTGLSVKTTGDVYIHGMVEEACHVEAGGDIEITQGVIGRGSIKEDNGQPGKGIVCLRCRGSLTAKFIENCVVMSGKDIVVAELIAHSDITASGKVIVGLKNSRRGQIMGGITRADQLVQAQTIGTQGGNHTRVEVGPIHKYEHHMGEIEDLLKAKYAERTNIEKVFAQAFKAQKADYDSLPPFLHKLQQTLNRLAAEINGLKRQQQHYQEYVETLRSAKIQVNKQVLNAVEFLICDTPRKFNLEHIGGTFTFDGKESKVEFHP